jgi:DNA-binding transcriptional MerR regulator
MEGRLSIGELSRRTGVPVKTLRFYSDEGLLPPAGRTQKNYRFYTEEHVVRIDLIRTLREAGIGLDEIGKVLRRDIQLKEALRLRLDAVEAHITSLKRVASALRAAIRSGASDIDLRRISMVTHLTNQERRRVIESFYDKVAEGISIDKTWIRGAIDATCPTLPDDPTPEQLDAWIELARIFEDPTFVESMRANAMDFWSGDVDLAHFNKEQGIAVREAAEARARGLEPSSPEGLAVANRLLRALVEARGAKDDVEIRANMRKRYDPRAERTWELVAIMKGEDLPRGTFEDTKWLSAAVRHHLL